MTPAELELAFLSTHLDQNRALAALNAGIDSTSFQVEEHAKAWGYIESRAKAGIELSVGDLEAAFGLKLYVASDHETWLEKMSELSVLRKSQLILAESVPNLKSTPVDTVRGIVEQLTALTQTNRRALSIFDDSIDQRMSYYLDRAIKVKQGVSLGIPSGIATIDREDGGFSDGELIAVLGPMNIGKSTVLLSFAAAAYYHGKAKVLILSPESTVKDMEAKLDPMIAHKMGFKLSNRSLRLGTENEEELTRYAERLKALKRKDMVILDSGSEGVFSLDEIVALIRMHRPDLAVVDGFHLIRGKNRTKTWETFMEAAQVLKGLAQALGTVIVAGSQVNREAILNVDDTADLGQSAYGLALEESANKVIHLGEVKGDPMRRVFRINKNRDGAKVKERRYLYFDVDGGDIREATLADAGDGLVSFE